MNYRHFPTLSSLLDHIDAHFRLEADDDTRYNKDQLSGRWKGRKMTISRITERMNTGRDKDGLWNAPKWHTVLRVSLHGEVMQTWGCISVKEEKLIINWFTAYLDAREQLAHTLREETINFWKKD